ncbi:IclR family transcriptional regulator [Paenirhodobacter populi]|uniref:IclR family transcriptional regulator n=1 Tax=Paenirhodobacter populi TaxID=2306993 RepID=A0A443JKM8_9RHOB|nr:IclR family transcriptional regulator [Sinirhodobacter populi]RWR21070.1 IclR family transcriptional regulator [Sinirhodobacter populi]
MGYQETIPGVVRGEVTGTQCIRRSFAILRLLAGGDHDGEKLVDIAGALKLSHPTTHRILKALEQEGIVERAGGSQRYRLGAEAAWLGVGPFNRCPITRLSAIVLEDLAQATGDSIFLSVPSHNDAVYADRRLGNWPVQARGVHVGARRPMGVSVGGRVMLAHLGEARMKTVLAENADRFADWNCPMDQVLRGIEDTRAQGYLVDDSLTRQGRRAMAVPVRDVGGRAIGAISIIAPTARLGSDRVARLLPLLREGARRVGTALFEQRMAS